MHRAIQHVRLPIWGPAVTDPIVPAVDRDPRRPAGRQSGNRDAGRRGSRDPHIDPSHAGQQRVALGDRKRAKAEAMAVKVVTELKSPGLFAIEFFIDVNDNVLVNETAPRVHNSGHHTIEANYSSQFDMLWRIMLNFPMGNTDPILPSAIVNIIGADGYTGPAIYEGLSEVMAMENAFVHLYGKLQTKPGRKMGHVTILSKDYHELTFKAHKIKHLLKVIS